MDMKLSSYRVVLIPVFVMLMSSRLCSGHGRLLAPPSRASMWRDPHFREMGAPINYDDNGLNCGGRAIQHEQNEGKCGICGDNWNGPRPHEAGGRYANGIITASYTRGDVIQARVHVTASHLGYFEFRICPNNDVNTPATQECLDRYLLSQVNGGTRFYYGSRAGIYDVSLQLPDDLVCSTQCVLQWRWRTGNSWGKCSGSGGWRVGCGPQEEFYSCADITITDSNNPDQPDSTVPTHPTQATATQNTATATPKSSTTEQPTTKTTATQKTASPPTTTTSPPTTTTSPQPTSPSTRGCRAIRARQSQGMNRWCRRNCARGYCPRSHCTCSDDPEPGANCKPTAMWAQTPNMLSWCQTNCAAGYCPRSHCRCG